MEIVSDTQNGELSEKLRIYERMRVLHYVVFDPLRVLSDAELVTFALEGGAYVQRDARHMPGTGLGVTVWEGEFEGIHERWLRWCDHDGELVPTGNELATRERQRAEQEKQRAERLAARLRALGVDPDSEG